MHFANCMALAAILFTDLIENLRLNSTVEAGIVLNFFLNIEQKLASFSYKIVLIKISVAVGNRMFLGKQDLILPNSNQICQNLFTFTQISL